MTANAMNQLIRLYAAIEIVLRSATETSAYITMAELKEHPQITAVMLNPNQVRDAVDNLFSKGYASSVGERMDRRYFWVDMSKTYTPTQRQLKSVGKAHGEVTDPMKDNVTVNAISPAVQKEIELVVAGMTIVISKNAATGRPRIVIEG